MKKKIYMAGCGGMLGEAFYRVFNDHYDLKCTDKDVNADWLSFLDFREADAYRKDVHSFGPDYLFHLGAYTDLEFCETNVDDTYVTNTKSVEYAVDIANELNIPLLYISTAGIFDGKKQQYDDWDTPNPLGHYARSKYLGERHVIETCKTYLICRAGWMMGGGPDKDKKFINKLITQIVNGKRELFVVDDKDGTPTYTIDFAKNVEILIKKESWDLYNMVCKGQTSRYEVANELIRLIGLENKIKVTKVSSDYFQETYFAERPISERLVNKKLELNGMNNMRDWKLSLSEYIHSYYLEYLKDKI